MEIPLIELLEIPLDSTPFKVLKWYEGNYNIDLVVIELLDNTTWMFQITRGSVLGLTVCTRARYDAETETVSIAW